jgi:hypothetical protein
MSEKIIHGDAELSHKDVSTHSSLSVYGYSEIPAASDKVEQVA